MVTRAPTGHRSAHSLTTRVPTTRRRPATRAIPKRRPSAAAGDVFGALADPTRRRLLELLRDGEQPVHQLATAFRVTRPAISQHLGILRSAGLVAESRAGRERMYRLHAKGLREIHSWIAQYEAFWDDRLGRLGAVLDAEARRERHRS